MNTELKCERALTHESGNIRNSQCKSYSEFNIESNEWLRVIWYFRIALVGGARNPRNLTDIWCGTGYENSLNFQHPKTIESLNNSTKDFLIYKQTSTGQILRI